MVKTKATNVKPPVLKTPRRPAVPVKRTHQNPVVSKKAHRPAPRRSSWFERHGDLILPVGVAIGVGAILGHFALPAAEAEIRKRLSPATSPGLLSGQARRALAAAPLPPPPPRNTLVRASSSV